MANGAGLTGDNALRTPMSWTSDPSNAGFSTVMPFRALSQNSTTQNVAMESGDSSTLLGNYEAILTLRNEYPVIGAGDLDVQSQVGDPVLLVTRSATDECVVIAINYSGQSQAISAATECPGATFDAIYGIGGTVVASSSGVVAANASARQALVLRSGN
jgi:glycosidase